jgi:hypothetical protein
MGSFAGNDGWPQEASIIHVPSALKLNLLEYPFSWSTPDNSSRSGSRSFGDLRSFSALSFTFSELEGMGSCWASNQQKASRIASECGNDFVDSQAWNPGHRRTVSALSNDVVACRMNNLDVSAISFALDYELDESDSDDTLTF